jgi:hypothetical protein
VLALAVEGAAVAVTVAVAVGGAVVGGAVVGGAVVVPDAGLVAVLLVTLPIALLTELPHPAARHPTARIAIRRRKALFVLRMLAMIR